LVSSSDIRGIGRVDGFSLGPPVRECFFISDGIKPRRFAAADRGVAVVGQPDQQLVCRDVQRPLAWLLATLDEKAGRAAGSNGRMNK
jgi:hypothetical protein